MRNFIKIAENIDIIPLMLEIDRNPDLWNEIDYRKTEKDTPHSDMSDIWIRYRPRSELTTRETYLEQHIPEWYPAYYKLPSLRNIIFALMARVYAVHLGGIFITKIPPGGRIRTHKDIGWHAEYHNCKVYLPIKSNPYCMNICEDESVVMNAGDVWTFNNLFDHSVENNGDDDRMTLIISMRCE